MFLLSVAAVADPSDLTSGTEQNSDTEQPADGEELPDTEQPPEPTQTDEPRITFCDERTDGWTPRSRLVSVVLERHIHHDGNIIPAFTAVIDDDEVSYPGLNLDTEFDGVSGREILGNNCVMPIAAAEPPPPPVSRSAPTTPLPPAPMRGPRR